jgi:DNA ligase (NAD+)
MKKLDSKAAAERVAKLKEIINEYRYEYHVNDRSLMSEAAADSLKHELSQLEEQFPDLVTPDSPTQRVAGKPLGRFQAVAHSSRMLSLNDVFDESELEAWAARVAKMAPDTQLEYFVDLKMDGFACALVYEDGLLVRAVTRGDGFVGEDVTTNVRTLDSVPLKLRAGAGYEKFQQGRTEVRGEIVMYKKDFDQLNKSRKDRGLALFANPRNTAAGTIRQLDPKLVAERPLHFRAYDVLRDDEADLPTYAQTYQVANILGFLANKDAPVLKSVEEVKKFADRWEDKRHNLPFNTDGLVVKINDRSVYSRLGVVGKAPRGAAAYKYPAEQSTTRVKDIFISIGRTGAATPVAMLEAVVVAGSTVQMATLHNESEVLRKDIRVGDTVIIHKAGDIIPEVLEAITKLRPKNSKAFVMPKSCPECGTKLAKLKADDAVWRCPNEQCPSRVFKRIQHYASKSALDIEGLGEKYVIALLQADLIKETPDIYELKPNQVEKLDRFAEVSARKLVEAIQAKKQPTLARFLYGLGIRHVGSQTAVDLANHFRSLSAIVEATIEDLADVEGVGEVVAESIVAWFSEPGNQKILEKFAKLGVGPKEVKRVGGKLSGQSFVITGGLDSMQRQEAAEKIRALGGTFQSSVGKETNFLVVGNNVGASKLAKADKLGVKQIDEQALLKLLTNE